MPLTIEIAGGETILIDGVSVYFANRVRISVDKQVPVLRAKMIMRPSEAITPITRLYIALQFAYAGPRDQRRDNLCVARNAIEEMTTNVNSADLLGVLESIKNSQLFEALRKVRRLVDVERAFSL